MNPIVNLSDRALKVLVILLLAGQPLGLEAIKAAYKKPVGYKTLKDALYELESERLVARVSYRGGAYVAAREARQMILGEDQILQTSTTEVSLSEQPGRGAPNITKVLQTSTAEVSNLYRRGFDSPLEEEEGRDLEEIEKPPPPLGQSETSATEVSQADVLAALDEAGIAEPARSQIADLSWATPDYIQAHVKAANSLGLAIYRIKHKFRRPQTPQEKRATNYLKYLE